MSDSTLNSCKTALGNLIASDKIQEADNPLEAFTEGIQNFLAHYCHDQHTSSWCYHPKVKKKHTRVKISLMQILGES